MHVDRTVFVADHIVGIGFHRRFHQGVFIDTFGEGDLPLALEQVGHRTVGTQVAATLAEGMTNSCRGAVAVVGHALDHHRHAVGAVAFIGQLDHIVAAGSAGATGDGPVDDVAAHVGTQGLVQGQAQAWVGVGIAAALTGRDGQLTNPLGENLASLGILTLFAVLDVRPLGMTCHNLLQILFETLPTPPGGCGQQKLDP